MPDSLCQFKNIVVLFLKKWKHNKLCQSWHWSSPRTLESFLLRLARNALGAHLSSAKLCQHQYIFVLCISDWYHFVSTCWLSPRLSCGTHFRSTIRLSHVLILFRNWIKKKIKKRNGITLSCGPHFRGAIRLSHILIWFRNWIKKINGIARTTTVSCAWF